MAGGRILKNPSSSKRVQKVQIVKPKRKRRKRFTNLLTKKQMVKLHYATEQSLNPGAGAIVAHHYRANSIFDPDFTGVGHQPLLHDQYALLYGDYRVVSSKITVTPVYSTTTSQQPAYWGVYNDNDSLLGYASIEAAIEDKPRTKQWQISIGKDSSINMGKGARQLRATFRNTRDLAPEGRDNATTFGANPTGTENVAFYTLWVGSVGGNDPGVIDFMVEMEFLVELTAPLVVAQS